METTQLNADGTTSNRVPAMMAIFDEGEWKPFAVVHAETRTIHWLLSIMNDSLGELGITVRSILPPPDTAARTKLWDQFNAWLSMHERYSEGLYDELPDEYPKLFLAAEFLPHAAATISELKEEVDAEGLPAMRATYRLKSPTQPQEPPARNNPDKAAIENAKSRARRNWYFDDDPEPTSKYKHGIAVGHLYQLAHAMGQSPNNVKDHNGEKWYYIRQLHSRSFALWATSEVLLARVQSGLPEAEES